MVGWCIERRECIGMLVARSKIETKMNTGEILNDVAVDQFIKWPFSPPFYLRPLPELSGIFLLRHAERGNFYAPSIFHGTRPYMRHDSRLVGSKPDRRSDKAACIVVSSLRKSKGAVYTAFVAPSRPKNESVTNQPTDRPTDGRTHAHIESLRRD